MGTGRAEEDERGLGDWGTGGGEPGKERERLKVKVKPARGTDGARTVGRRRLRSDFRFGNARLSSFG